MFVYVKDTHRCVWHISCVWLKKNNRKNLILMETDGENNSEVEMEKRASVCLGEMQVFDLCKLAADRF